MTARPVPLARVASGWPVCLGTGRFDGSSERPFGGLVLLAIDPSRCSMGGLRPLGLGMGWGSGGASLTGLSRATHAWDRLSAGTLAHAVTAVTAVPAP